MIVKLHELNDVAKELINKIENNTFILLHGDLGAGKTTFTKQLIKELGVATNVTSPSFNIMNQYKTDRININHIDAYRLTKNDELDMFLEAFVDSINIVEWPNNLNINYKEFGKVIEIFISTVDDETRQFKIIKK